MKNKLIFKVKDLNEKTTIREYLKYTQGLSTRILRSSAIDKRLFLNGNVVKLNKVLKNDDLIELIIEKEETQNIDPEPIPIDIVFEDEDLIVLNKAPGIVVHPTKSYPNHTLANGIIHYFREKGENTIVRLVSRLDMDTSGLIIIAKNQFSHMALSRDMSSTKFKKFYFALVENPFNKEELKGTINKPIYRTTDDSIKRIVDDRGQESITHYEVIENFNSGALIRLQLETGRTHQIRVHMESIGHPLFGDTLYGNGENQFINRQALHACRLEFPHPKNGNIIKLDAPIPHDMLNLINKLKEDGV